MPASVVDESILVEDESVLEELETEIEDKPVNVPMLLQMYVY